MIDDFAIKTLSSRLKKEIKLNALKKKKTNKVRIVYSAEIQYKDTVFSQHIFFSQTNKHSVEDLSEFLNNAIEQFIQMYETPYTTEQTKHIMSELIQEGMQDGWVVDKRWDYNSLYAAITEYIKEFNISYNKANNNIPHFGKIYQHCMESFVEEVVKKQPDK